MSTALLFALALLASPADNDAQGGDAAVATAPAPVGTQAGQPTTEYELVAWCYGALGAHMGLHDVAMPEVTRIEQQFERIPGAGKADLESYEQQRVEGVRQLALFRGAIEAAEKASAEPLHEKGVEAIRKGEAVWTGAQMADPKFLAREWMSWALPARCETTATALAGNAAEPTAPAETPATGE
jgi:hypothetical protein